MKTIRTLLWVGLLAASLTGLIARAAEARDTGPGLRGDISVLAYDFCPAGWLPTDGRELLIQNYQPLFQVLGTRYGGDGQTTFALPQFDCSSAKLTCCLLADRAALSHAGPGELLGEIELVAFNFCPDGWLPTDGRQLPIQSNQPLFVLLGTRYGGDGRTTFALPQLDCGDGKCCISTRGVFPNR
jgi:microcystin-dependent protein